MERLEDGMTVLSKFSAILVNFRFIVILLSGGVYMFEILFLDGSTKHIRSCLLHSYIKLYKSRIYGYRKIS